MGPMSAAMMVRPLGPACTTGEPAPDRTVATEGTGNAEMPVLDWAVCDLERPRRSLLSMVLGGGGGGGGCVARVDLTR